MKHNIYIIAIVVSALALHGCRPLGDDLLSYGQDDYQAFAEAGSSFAGEFNTFWMAMNENYCIWDYEAEFGLDWDEVYDTYLPQFEALDDTTYTKQVTDEQLKALYSQFVDSLHDGHIAFRIKNLHTGKYITLDPNVNRNKRERPEVYAAENNVTTLDAYLNGTMDNHYQIHDYGTTCSNDIIVQIIDTTAHRLLRATEAYIQAVDAAGGPDRFNDSIYVAVENLNYNAHQTLDFLANPDIAKNISLIVSEYNKMSQRYTIVARQIGVTIPVIDEKLSKDYLQFIRFALFEGNIAYLRLGGFYLSNHLSADALSSDTGSVYHAYQLEVRKVWHQWFDTIQVLHANGQLGGVIIDVRNNGGGYTSDYKYVVGALLPSGGWESHTLRVKNGTGRLDFAPLVPFIMETYPYEHAVITTEPIVLLANSHSLSLSENSTWGVKCQPNGYVIGTRTAGGLSALATDPKYYSTTYSGAFGVDGKTPVYGYVPKYVCLYPQENGDLAPMESFGFEPDESVPFDLQLWNTHGRDNQLERAIDYIQGH